MIHVYVCHLTLGGEVAAKTTHAVWTEWITVFTFRILMVFSLNKEYRGQNNQRCQTQRDSNSELYIIDQVQKSKRKSY